MTNERAGVVNKDVVVVGAGFGGLYAIHKLRSQGLSVQAFETGDDVGGTWYWNRYPGARCDVESMEYSYSFSPELEREWVWSERYAPQPEILRYLQHVAERFDLRRDIAFETRVTAVHYEDATGLWRVRTDRGDEVLARFCVMATGCLSAGSAPNIPGLADFTGTLYQTHQWPKEQVDVTGLRVGVVGTGSSGIQVIPMLAQQAAQLTVFQRTPNFSVPALNRPLGADERQSFIDRYPELRNTWRHGLTGLGCGDPPPVSALEVDAAERTANFQKFWNKGGPCVGFTYNDLIVNKAANDTLSEFIRERIRDTVKDPAVAEKLLPRFPVATKRMCVDTNYYATYNKPNVELIDIKQTPIERITATGVQVGGREVPLDVLVLATGFDAVTGAVLRMDIRGHNGLRLADKWQEGPKMYLGLMTHGFPNLFTITGAGSPSIVSSMIISIEQHVEYIADLLAYMARRGLTHVEAEQQAEEQWAQHVTDVADGTLYPGTASLYVGANIPGKPRVMLPYLGGVGPYRQKCDEIAAADYVGFALSA